VANVWLCGSVWLCVALVWRCVALCGAVWRCVALCGAVCVGRLRGDAMRRQKFAAEGCRLRSARVAWGYVATVFDSTSILHAGGMKVRGG